MDRLQVIDSEAARLAEVLAQADPAAPVPTCPEWNAAALLWHLTNVHRFWAAVLSQNPQSDAAVEAIENDEPAAPDTVEQMLPIRAAATADLIAQLGRLNDDEPRWSWWDSEQTVGFTRRMQTYEATMHRVDAELAAGTPVSPIPAEVAAGAIDHCVDVMWGWMPDWADYEAFATVEIVATDTGQRWPVEIGHWFGTGPESGNSFDMIRAVRAADGDLDGSVTGTVEQLARWAWGRQPDEGSIVIEGSDEAKDAVGKLIKQGIQ